MKEKTLYFLNIILCILLAGFFILGCEDTEEDDDDNETCEPVSGTCHYTPYTHGDRNIELTIDSENPQATIYIYEDDIDPTDLPAPYTTITTSSSSYSINLPVGDYSGVIYYQYEGKTFMAIDGDSIENDGDFYCEGYCYELEEGELDLKLDKDAIDEYFEVEDAKCFIATATYGSPLAHEVQLLRKFRDRYLLTNKPGSFLVDLYYTYSPPLAQKIRQHKPLKYIFMILLTPLVYCIKYPYALIILISSYFFIRYSRKTFHKS
jgi:hypothetical protein